MDMRSPRHAIGGNGLANPIPQEERASEDYDSISEPEREADTAAGRYEAYHEWSDEVLRPMAAEIGTLMPGARAAKTAVAAGVAWWLGNLLGEPRPMFAALGALVAVEATIVGSVQRTGLQLVGILGGVVLAAVLTYFSEMSALVAGVAVLFGLWLGRLFHSPDRVGVELSVTALLVVALGKGDVGFGVSRLWEVGLGGLVAATINALILPPNYVGEVARSLDALIQQVAGGLEEAVRIFAVLPRHEGASETRLALREARQVVPAVQSRLKLAQDALRFSPMLRGEQASIDRCREALRLYDRASSHASRIARVVVQHAQRPHTWSHDSHLASTDALLEIARNLAEALREFQSFVWHGDLVALAEAERAHHEAERDLASFYSTAARERAETEMERLVDVGAIASELEHLTLDVGEAIAAVHGKS